MSIYCTTWTLENDADDCPLGAPYVYGHSNVTPALDRPRDGTVDLGAIPEHIGPECRQFLRLSVCEVEWPRCEHDGATVILDRTQVEDLRDALTWWLDEWPPQEPAEGSPPP